MRKIRYDRSPIHGLGVFATEFIAKGELVEECPVLSLPITKGESTDLMIDYRFNWPSGSEWQEQVMALGYGSLYNHNENANAYWYSVNDRRVFHFIASRDIEAGEEIFVYYGDVSYWNDGRNKIEVK
jgi:SET domain-containing protein